MESIEQAGFTGSWRQRFRDWALADDMGVLDVTVCWDLSGVSSYSLGQGPFESMLSLQSLGHCRAGLPLC